MMMPANFSAVSENEMTYVVGNLAAIYNLGFGKVKNAAESTFVKDGAFAF